MPQNPASFDAAKRDRLREEMARAIGEALAARYRLTSAFITLETIEAMADAALAAARESLREPTPAMIEAATWAAVDGCPVDVAAPRVWRAMWSAAFEEPGR